MKSSNIKLREQYNDIDQRIRKLQKIKPAIDSGILVASDDGQGNVTLSVVIEAVLGATDDGKGNVVLFLSGGKVNA